MVAAAGAIPGVEGVGVGRRGGALSILLPLLVCERGVGRVREDRRVVGEGRMVDQLLSVGGRAVGRGGARVASAHKREKMERERKKNALLIFSP